MGRWPPSAPSAPPRWTTCPTRCPRSSCSSGDEELLVTRSISAVAAAARRRDADVSETERAGSEIDGPELHETARPVAVRRRAAARRSARPRICAPRRSAVLTPYLEAPAEGTTLVLQHAGGAKGKALLEAARKPGRARDPVREGHPRRRARRLRPGRGAPRRAGGSSRPRWPRSSTRSAATCASSRPPARSWSATPAARSTVDLVARLPPGPRRGVAGSRLRPRGGRQHRRPRSRRCATRSTSACRTS